jgi:hypothetical protein
MIKIINLEIVGYCDVLPKEKLPCVVPPLFREFKAEDNKYVFYVPPYHISTDGHLYGAKEIDEDEVVSLLLDKKEITLGFPRTIKAKPNHTLWVGPDRNIKYQPSHESDEELSKLYTDYINRAIRLFGDYMLSEADDMSSLAINADDRKITPLVIKAAIARLQMKPITEIFFRKLASKKIDEWLFDELVENIIKQGMV